MGARLSVAVRSTRAAAAGDGAAAGPRRRRDCRNSALAGSAASSARSRTTGRAFAESMARTSAGSDSPWPRRPSRTGPRQPRRPWSGAGGQRAGQVHPHVAAGRERRLVGGGPDQLACCASASVPVATAMTSSSAAPPWRSGWRLNCQPASAPVSPRPRAASRSAARAAGGQQPQRENRAARERQRGREREHGVDGAGPAARRRGDGRVTAQLPAGEHRERDEGQVSAGPGRARHGRLAAAADSGPRPDAGAAPGRASRRQRARR